MLHDQGLPLHLWAEACNTLVYLQNRSLHHILGMKTPEEDFSSKRPNVGHFRIFGSSVYFHVTKDAQKKIKALRSDNDGEYVSQEFKDFCAAEGIKRELTTSHNPQQIGVAKRKNWTIVGAAWTMLHDQGLPLHFGLRHVTQWYIFIIEACITYLGWRHQRKLSPGRDQMWVTSGSLAHRFISMWPRMPRRS